MTKAGIKTPLFQLLSNIYPEHEWLPWKFQQPVPKGFYNDPSNRRKFVDWVAAELHIKEMSDWYNVTSNVKKSAGNYF